MSDIFKGNNISCCYLDIRQMKTNFEILENKGVLRLSNKVLINSMKKNFKENVIRCSNSFKGEL